MHVLIGLDDEQTTLSARERERIGEAHALGPAAEGPERARGDGRIGRRLEVDDHDLVRVLHERRLDRACRRRREQRDVAALWIDREARVRRLELEAARTGSLDDGEARTLVLVLAARHVTGREHEQAPLIRRGLCANSGPSDADETSIELLAGLRRQERDPVGGAIEERDAINEREGLELRLDRRIVNVGAVAAGRSCEGESEHGDFGLPGPHGLLPSTTRDESSNPVSVRATPLSRSMKVRRPSGCCWATNTRFAPGTAPTAIGGLASG